MSTDERESAAAVSDEMGEPELEAQKPKRKLEIAVNITDVGPCKKHLKITIPREEIDRQYEESLDSLRKEALVPGFRMGRAPRQLVVKRFKKQVSDQVKSSLLMSSLEQIDEDYKLDPITQPRLDVDAIEIPENGPMNFEMDVEVRPQFDVPNYTGLKVRRPVAEVRDEHVEQQLTRVLERQGQIVPKLEGAAELGDYLTADIEFVRPDGQSMSEFKEVQFRIKPELRFQDGSIPDASPLVGAKPGDTRELDAKLGSSVIDTTLRGTTAKVRVTVNDLKRLRIPELNQSFLDSISFESAAELRDAVRESLERRIRNEQRQAIRHQLLDQLLSRTPFELPAELVRARSEARSVAWWRSSSATACPMTTSAPAKPRSGPTPTKRLCETSRRSCCYQRSPKPKESPSTRRTWRSKSTRWRHAPVKVPGGSALASKRKGAPIRWRTRSSSKR